MHHQPKSQGLGELSLRIESISVEILTLAAAVICHAGFKDIRMTHGGMQSIPTVPYVSAGMWSRILVHDYIIVFGF